MKSKNYIWVVEVFDDGKWEPSVNVGLTRAQARMEKRVWFEESRNYAKLKLRIRKYVPQPFFS